MQDQDSSTSIESSDTKDAIFTFPNVISFIRLCLIPFSIYFMYAGKNIMATAFFAVAAATDFVDGQVARHTNSVSNLGKIMDPAIDTLLMITGVLGTYLLGRLPLWIVVLIFAREVFLLVAGAILLKRCEIRIPVVYPGKFATTFLFIGFSFLILNMPFMDGMSIINISWLPGFNSEICNVGIWFIYLGLSLQIGVTIYYCITAYNRLQEYLHRKNPDAQ